MRGGKRIGAGRKNTGPTKNKTFRLHTEFLEKAIEIHGRNLNKLVDDFIKSLVS